PADFAAVARQALRICHFDPATGEADPTYDGRCAVACYECLLSYTNQLLHRHLDRRLVRDYLLRLAGGATEVATADRGRDDQLTWLAERIDPASTLERDFLLFLYRSGHRLPDAAQTHPE